MSKKEKPNDAWKDLEHGLPGLQRKYDEMCCR